MDPGATSDATAAAWARRRGADFEDEDAASGVDEEEPATQVALTQLAPTQQSAAPPPMTRADVEVVRCMICALNLTAKSIMERELHLNACLDASSLEAKYDCPTCGKHLTDYNEQRRMAHVNLCLDRVARFTDENRPFSSSIAVPIDSQVVSGIADASGVPPSAGGETITGAESTEDLYECRICGQSLALRGLEARSRHVKQCGQRFGLRAADLAATAETDETSAIAVAKPATTLPPPDADKPNAFAVLMASSIARTSEITRSVASVASNAFDVLMKSSRTEAVAQATASTSARAFWHTNNPKAPKRPRFNSSSTSAAPNTRRYGCPDFKRVLGTQPPFIVDGFRYASKSLSSVYFLTHFHSDHYVGLQKNFDCGIIYCNQVTAALTVQELGIDAKFVHPVPMNTPVDVHGVQVTFMDANHCPGAAIILFRLRSGVTYLHTGDFRFHPKMWAYAPLKPFLPSTCAATGVTTPPSRRMDGVYLDTTYADPKYTFPTQEASIQHALSLVEKHMSAAEKKVLFLFGSYSIGKERLFIEVAQRYDRKVCVSKAKLKMIKTYAWPDAQMRLLTTEPAATNLHVVPMQELKLEHLVALQQKHRLRFHQIVAFRPTGWTFSRSNASLSSCQSDPSGAVRIYGIPYSEHSSFAELCDFVRELNPQLIIPTVNCHTERSVKKQIDALKQSAFHGIGSMFAPVAVNPK